MELLTEKSRLMPESHDSPFCLRKQNHDNRKHTSFLSGDLSTVLLSVEQLHGMLKNPSLDKGFQYLSEKKQGLLSCVPVRRDCPFTLPNL